MHLPGAYFCAASQSSIDRFGGNKITNAIDFDGCRRRQAVVRVAKGCSANRNDN